MTDYVAGIIALWILPVLQLNPWISRWVFGNKGRFLTVIGQKWSWCHFIKGCLVLSHLISTCHFSFIQQGKVEIISYPLVCHSPSFHRVHSTVAGIVVTVSVEPPVLVNSLSWFCLIDQLHIPLRFPLQIQLGKGVQSCKLQNPRGRGGIEFHTVKRKLIIC